MHFSFCFRKEALLACIFFDMKKLRVSVLVLLAVSVVAFSFTRHDRYFEIARSLETFASLYKLVNKYYVDPVSPTGLANDAIVSMLASLDPYTNYIPEDQIEDYRTMTTGEYGGIGAEVELRDQKIIVTMPLEGYAAANAGIRRGDEILKINGIDIGGRPVSNIERLLKGQADGTVSLTIKRPGVDEEFALDVTYEKVKQKNVPFAGMVTESIGLIQLTDFTHKAGQEVEEALLYLKSLGAEKIILDLRGNPGGLLNEAVNISNVFLPRGSDIVKMRGRFDEWSNDYLALNEAIDTEISLAVLIDENSASASEIVSGVLQDYDRGVVVGQRSFGKGLVQTTTPLSYNSQLKVTVAKYFIPSGRCIQEIDYSKKMVPAEERAVDTIRDKFSTMAGRAVYDGAGIEPDLFVDVANYSPVATSLLEKKLIFDYASLFRTRYDSIEAAGEFSLTDAQYKAFVEWVQQRDFGYQTEVETNLDLLTTTAKEERYYEGISSQIISLREEIARNKAEDLLKFKPEIKQLLELEIVKHYFLQTGAMEYSFRHHPDILTAVDILMDETRYKAILSGKN
mgnify:CR=1 FL=1